MDTALDLANIAVNLVYIALFGTAMWSQRQRTYRGLVKAVKLMRIGVAVAVVALGIDLLSVRYDGWWPVALPVITVTFGAVALHYARQSRDLKGEQVTDEAIRQMQDRWF